MTDKDGYDRAHEPVVVEEKPKSGPERLFRWLFKKMFPKHPKRTMTPEGTWLRRIIGLFCVCHCFAFAFMMAFVGWSNSMFELYLIIFSYSAYLTLREWVLILYLLGSIGSLYVWITRASNS